MVVFLEVIMPVNSIKNNIKLNFRGESVNQEVPVQKAETEQKTDSVEIKAKVEPPEISTNKLIFKRLTDEQIEQVNKAGKLPENAKFIRDGRGGYYVAANLMNLAVGTRKIPEGFELRKDAFGFTCVLPKDSEGLFIKKKHEPQE